MTGRQHLQQAGATNSGLHMNTNDNSISSDTSESDGIWIRLISKLVYILNVNTDLSDFWCLFKFLWIVTRDASDSDSRSHSKSGVTGTGAGQNGKSNNADNVTNMAELNKGIRREVTRLSERWSALLVHANQWQAKLDDMLPVSQVIL